jgi:hypothetical protein
MPSAITSVPEEWSGRNWWTVTMIFMREAERVGRA